MKILRILVSIIVILVTLFRVVSCYQRGTKLTFDKSELYYTSQVTEAEAKKVGEVLVKLGYFKGAAASVQLNKSGGVYEFRAVVKKDSEKNSEIVEEFRAIGKAISDQALNKAKVAVHLCDDHLKTVYVIPDK
ncbi:MAG: hypothetical protein QOH88_1271 [Verrucomicrobiota bacterium]|jgi:hypothetical protein